MFTNDDDDGAPWAEWTGMHAADGAGNGDDHDDDDGRRRRTLASP